MPPAPHDLADLRLAPVALALNERLDGFAGLDQDELLMRVALETTTDPRTPAERSEALLDSVAHLLDLGGWELSWHVRGLEMRHGGHRLVLGISENLRAFLA